MHSAHDDAARLPLLKQQHAYGDNICFTYPGSLYMGDRDKVTNKNSGLAASVMVVNKDSQAAPQRSCRDADPNSSL